MWRVRGGEEWDVIFRFWVWVIRRGRVGFRVRLLGVRFEYV